MVITDEQKVDEITEVMKVEEVMAVDAWKEDVMADDACVEDVTAKDVCVENTMAADVTAEDVMAEGMRLESVRSESELEVPENKQAVSQEDEGDITDTVYKDHEESIAHDECMLKVSILDRYVWW